MTVNKENGRKKFWKISDMASQIPEDMILSVEPQGDSSVSPSYDRIKSLALQKRKEHLYGKEEKSVKKVSSRFVLVAVIASLLSVTVFATVALGGLDYMKGIFGSSATSVQNKIVTPRIKATDNGRSMAVEAMVTDGFVTNMVVSITGNQPDDKELFTVTSNTGIRSNGWHVLEEFTVPGKTYYAIDLVSKQHFTAADVSLSLNRQVAPISLSVSLENQLGNAVVYFPENAQVQNTELKQLQISPMGLLLICHEKNPQGGLPPTSMLLKLSNGKTEEIEMSFAASDRTVGGGGGAVLTDDPKDMPLISTFQGERNPKGELVISGQFSRIINPATIEKVVVGCVEYEVKHSDK